MVLACAMLAGISSALAYATPPPNDSYHPSSALVLQRESAVVNLKMNLASLRDTGMEPADVDNSLGAGAHKSYYQHDQSVTPIPGAPAATQAMRSGVASSGAETVAMNDRASWGSTSSLGGLLDSQGFVPS